MAIAVVTDNDERTFNATNWTSGDDQTLSVYADEVVVAEYSPGGWQYVLLTDSEVPTPARQ
jgi:hypothetical protein